MVAIVAALTMCVSYVDRTTLAVLAPSVTSALHMSETQYGALQSAFSLAYLFSVPVSGWWIDRAGARRGLTVSVLVWSVVAGLHAIIPGFGFLFAARIALGIAEGPGFPGAAQTVSRVLSPADRSRGFSLLFTGSSVGGMIAAPLASILYQHVGWRLAFLVSAAVGLLWVPLWLALTRSPGVRAAFGSASPAATTHALPEGRAVRAIVGDALMIRGLLGILAVAPAIGFVMAWGSKLLVASFHTPQGSVGHYLWLPPLGGDAGALLFGDLAARRRRPGDTPLALHAVAAAIGCAGLAILPSTTDPWQATACLSAASFGGFAVYTLVTSDLLGRMPPERASFVAGTLSAAQSIALIVSSPLIGRGVESFGGYPVVTWLLAAWVVPGSIAWWAWRPRVTSPQ